MSFPQLRSKIVNQLTSATAVVAYTLSAAAGSYSWTGSDASPKAGHVIVADSGAVTLTGTDATLNKGFTLGAANGAYNITGTDANFAVNLPADTNSYAWTGTPATLTYNSTSADLSVNYDWQREYPRAFQRSKFGKLGFNFVNAYNVTASSGSYAITGTDANFSTTQVGQWINQRDTRKHTWPRHFAPSPWGHLTGVRSLNRLSYATASYALTAASGSYVITGTAASLLDKSLISAQSGSIDWNVFAATLNRGRTLIATDGTVILTAAEVTFLVNFPADSGTWLWTGSAAGEHAARLLTANGTTYDLTGTAATLTYSRAAFAGSYIWTGNIATLRWSGESSSGRGGILLLGAG